MNCLPQNNASDCRQGAIVKQKFGGALESNCLKRFATLYMTLMLVFIYLFLLFVASIGYRFVAIRSSDKVQALKT